MRLPGGGVSSHRSHYLYRAFDRGGRLLYLGRTNNPRARMNQHRLGSAWWALMESVTVQLVEHDEILGAERAAIRAEGPLFNRDSGEGQRAFHARRRWRDEQHAAGLRCDLPIFHCADCSHHWKVAS